MYENSLIFNPIVNNQRFPKELRAFRGCEGYLAIRTVTATQHNVFIDYFSLLRCNNIKKDWREFKKIYDHVDNLEYVYLPSQDAVFDLCAAIYSTLDYTSPVTELTTLAALTCRWSAIKQDDLGSKKLGLPLSTIVRNLAFRLAPLACSILSPKFFFKHIDKIYSIKQSNSLSNYNYVKESERIVRAANYIFNGEAVISSSYEKKLGAIHVIEAEEHFRKLGILALDKLQSLIRKGIVFNAFTKAYWLHDHFVEHLRDKAKDARISNYDVQLLLKHNNLSAVSTIMKLKKETK